MFLGFPHQNKVWFGNTFGISEFGKRTLGLSASVELLKFFVSSAKVANSYSGRSGDKLPVNIVEDKTLLFVENLLFALLLDRHFYTLRARTVHDTEDIVVFVSL